MEIEELEAYLDDHKDDTFNLKEMRHLACNFAITCEKGYRGSFDEWYSKISPSWREIANQ